MIPGDKHDALAQWVLQSFEEVAKEARRERRLDFPKAEGRTMDTRCRREPTRLDLTEISFAWSSQLPVSCAGADD